jgi:ATP-dependent DNA helicase 2 subunit 1
MQTPQADEETPDGAIRGRSALHQVLEAVKRIEKSKVITGPADSVGLLVYNIDVSIPIERLNTELARGF